MAKLRKIFLFSQRKQIMMKILVLTEHDDCCGPMAAAFLRDYSERVEVLSAGRHPSKALPPLVVVAMRECLIDMNGYRPCDVSTVDLSEFDAVYECPDEPCPTDLQACRELRDFIKNESFKYYKKSRS